MLASFSLCSSDYCPRGFRRDDGVVPRTHSPTDIYFCREPPRERLSSLPSTALLSNSGVTYNNSLAARDPLSRFELISGRGVLLGVRVRAWRSWWVDWLSWRNFQSFQSSWKRRHARRPCSRQNRMNFREFSRGRVNRSCRDKGARRLDPGPNHPKRTTTRPTQSLQDPPNTRARHTSAHDPVIGRSFDVQPLA